MEIVDIVDENNIVLYSCSKQEAHKKGLLHRAVVAELIDSKGNMTLVRPNTHKQDAGRWVSPVGGHVTAGETEEEAMKRETFEEIGIKVVKSNYIGKGFFNRQVIGRQENHYFILYEIYSDEEPILSDESVEFKKFSLEELRKSLKESPELFGDAFLFVVKKFYPQLLN